MFVELSPELAAEHGIVHGGWITVETAATQISARAMVTRRLRPLRVEGRVLHQIGLPFHWAFAGEVVGDNANDLTSLVADPNVSMHEAKAFACRVRAGRREGPVPKPTKDPAPWPSREPCRTRRRRHSRRGDSGRMTDVSPERSEGLPGACSSAGQDARPRFECL
jgi:formate dehydrogenase major subunit